MLEQVFISYTHQHKDEVSEVAEYLRKSGLTVFLDKNLEPGRDWRKQLEERINACQVFLVFITKDILEKRDGPRADSFVFEEIHIAKEADVARIYPVIVGNISVEVDFPQIAGFHGTRVTSVLETVASKEFHQHVADLKEYIEAGGPRAAHDHMRALRADSVMWPTSGENLIEKQALALAVMLLEGEQLFLISDAAQIFQAQIETQLRDLTEGELEKQPRIFGGPDQSELLEEIGAHRMVPEVGLSAGIQLVEFKRPGHAAALIEYLWTEQPKVRELFVSWLQSIFEGGSHRQLALHLARGLAHLARFNFRGLEYEILSRFFKRQISHNERIVLSELLAAAYDEKANRPRVRAILQEIFEGAWIPQGVDLAISRAIALEVALGPLASRSPEPAIELLKKADPFVRDPSPAGQLLRDFILKSPLLLGVSGSAEEAEGIGFSAPVGSEIVSATDEDSNDAPKNDPAEVSTTNRQPAAKTADTTDEEDVLRTVKNTDAPTVYFLEALAQWINDPLPKERRIERQLPLWIFLSTFAEMPLYRDEASDRLCLEDLILEFGRRRPTVLATIISGFRRAALASRLSESNYPAAQHLNAVCRNFAKKRAKSAQKFNANEDAFLVLLQLCYAEIAPVGSGREQHLLRGSKKYMTGDEIAFVSHPLKAEGII